MNSIQRAWRSTIRKPVKSVLLLMVIITVSLFVLCGMACRNASVQTQDTTRQAVGAGLRLEINQANRTEALFEYSEMIPEGEDGSYGGVHRKKLETAYGTQWQVWTDNSFESLHEDDIKRIASASGISDYNIITKDTVAIPANFTRIEDPDIDQYNDFGGVTLIGNLKMELHFSVLTGNVSIKEGRMITANDKNVCVISQELAELNEFHIGDTIQFHNYHDKTRNEVYEAAIVGIYQTQQFMSPLMAGDTFRSENVIFSDLRFPEKVEGCEGDPCYEHAYFQVGDVDEYEDVKNGLYDIAINWERYDLIDKNGNMETMSQNFNDLADISTMLIIVTFIAGFVILFLIFMFWTKNRNQEIGILLSLGYTKASVLIQLLAEAMLIAILSFSIAFALAPVASEAAANYLVAAQVEQSQIENDMNADKVAYSHGNTDVKVTGVEVEITDTMLSFCGVGMTALICFSIGIAGIPVLRKKPRAILSELS